MNAITEMKGASVPDSKDVFLAGAAYFRLLRPACRLRAATADFCHAYKSIGLPPDKAPFASVLLGPPTGSLMVAKLRTQPFGSTRAPANWGRVTALTQWVLLAYFGVRLAIFADDCIVVEHAETIRSAFACAKLVIKNVRFRVRGISGAGAVD